jgi:hypothetical protein
MSSTSPSTTPSASLIDAESLRVFIKETIRDSLPRIPSMIGASLREFMPYIKSMIKEIIDASFGEAIPRIKSMIDASFRESVPHAQRKRQTPS